MCDTMRSRSPGGSGVSASLWWVPGTPARTLFFGLSAIDVFSVAYADDGYDAGVVIDGIDNATIANRSAPLVGSSPELL